MTALPPLPIPAPKTTIPLPGGRSVGVRRYGAAAGLPVLALHGAPASGLMFEPMHDDALRLGLTIIAPDRPGYAGAPSCPAWSLAQWTHDVGALIDALAIASFAVIGISGGGPYAAAAAAAFGDRCRALALVSPVGHLADPALRAGLAWDKRLLFLRLPRHPRTLAVLAGAARRAYFLAPDAYHALFVATLPETDRAILARPEIRASIQAMTRDAMRESLAGAVADLTLYGRPWAIDLAAITAPAILWQGLADTVVPPLAACDLARRISGCRLETIAGAGHFWIYDHVADVLGELQTLAA